MTHGVGENTGIRFTFDTNVNEVKKTITSNNHFTVIYARGRSLPTGETDEDGNIIDQSCGDLIGGIHGINTTALISAVILGYQVEKKERLKSEERIKELETKVEELESKISLILDKLK